MSAKNDGRAVLFSVDKSTASLFVYVGSAVMGIAILVSAGYPFAEATPELVGGLVLAFMGAAALLDETLKPLPERSWMNIAFGALLCAIGTPMAVGSAFGKTYALFSLPVMAGLALIYLGSYLHKLPES